ncbi:MAG TPA: hypothetical protein VIM25_12555, partial [Candidatus Limnocylindrales bacterium]
MTSEPRAFLTLDSGAATIAAALIGRVGGRWRLIGSLSMAAGADVDAVVTALGDRAVRADPDLAAALDVHLGGAAELPRLEVASHPPRRLAVVAASERALGANAMLFFDPVLRGVFGGELASVAEILAD